MNVSTSQSTNNPTKTAPTPQASHKVPSKAAKTVASKPKAPAAKKASTPAKPSPAPKAAQRTSPVKTAKQTKPKLVRDSFTLPEAEHGLIKQSKKSAVAAGRETKKSEVVRAALMCFQALPIKDQMAAYGRLPIIAVGRPKK